jgi:tetratricopeptide (TPR) repeat protein
MLFLKRFTSRILLVFLISLIMAGCATHQYVPVKQTVKEPDKARKTFTNVTPAALNQHRQAIQLFNQGDYPGAARHWREALQSSARDPLFQFEINYNLGVTFLRMGKFILAEQHFGKCLALQGNDAKATAGLGSALASQGRFPEALTEYQKALAKDPMMAEAYSGIAAISIKNGRFEQAVDFLRSATYISPSDATIRATLTQAYLALGENRLAGGDLDGAEECYSKAAALDTQSARALYGLGHSMIKRGYPGRALPYYKQARDLEPNFQAQPEDLMPGPRTAADSAEAIRAEGMAAYLLERGDFERSAVQYELSLTREPTKIESWAALGDIYINHMDRRDKAADCLHALWMLGVTDSRAENLAQRLVETSPPIADTSAVELVYTQAGTGFAAAGGALLGVSSKFAAGSAVYRQANLKLPPGKHKFLMRLIDPSGKAVREDTFEVDCVKAERRLTVFDTLPAAGAWKQEWWVDGNLMGSVKFDLQ